MIKFSAYKMLHTAEGNMPFDVSLTVDKGQLVSLYGNSGAGKTTLLRILAGLTPAEKSAIEVDEEMWDNSKAKFHKPAQQRSVGFMFQDFALFPNMSVKENLTYALPKGGHDKVINELLELMELQTLQHVKPHQLSGGQQQRVALARAIVRKPKVLLLDEPLSALDDDMRQKLQDYILQAHSHYHLTTILVSHHLPEIIKLADKVIVLDKGRITREDKPANIFVAGNPDSQHILVGEIIAIEKSDEVFIIKVSAAGSVIKVIAAATEAGNFKIGGKLLVSQVPATDRKQNDKLPE